jgi:hypothetical protein
VKRGGTLARRTPLARKPARRRDTVPAKPTGETLARRLVTARSGGVCERCDRARAVHSTQADGYLWRRLTPTTDGGYLDASGGAV